MISVQSCENPTEWDDVIIENGGHPLQLWGWGEVKARNGWIIDRLFLHDGSTRVGALQVLTKKLPFPLKAFSYAPRNTLFHVKQEECLEAIASFVKEKYKSVALSIEPDSLEFEKPPRWVGAVNTILPSETILIDLSEEKSDLQAAMAKKTRQYIRKSTKEVEIRQIKGEDEFNACLAIYKETASRAGFALHNDDYYRGVRTHLGEHSPIFAAFSKGVPVAFLWLGISGTTAYELYGGMNDEGQRLRANYALKWHVITKMKEWGLTKYDFGGVISGGVATFKQGWVSESTHLAGTFDRPLSPFYPVWSHALPVAKKLAQKVRGAVRR